MRPLLALLVALATAGAALAQTTTTLYKSTGADGKTVYSDRPAPDAREAKTLTFRNVPASPLSAETLAYIAQLKKSADVRAKGPPPSADTVLFSAVWCPYCRQAKAHLAARRIPYREIDIDTKDGLMAYIRAGGGQSGVPLLISNGRSVSGFSAATYDALLAPRS